QEIPLLLFVTSFACRISVVAFQNWYIIPGPGDKMKNWFVGGMALGVFLSGSVLLDAHHAVAAKFDPAKPVSLTGPVVEIDWANPHVHIFVDVKGANLITNWAVELESSVDLQRSGWRPDTLKPGDIVTVQGLSARDGSKQAWANSVVVAATKK